MKLTSGNIRNLANTVVKRLVEKNMVDEAQDYIVYGTVKKAIKECFGIDTRESV